MPGRATGVTPPSAEAVHELLVAVGNLPGPATAGVIVKSVEPPNRLKEAAAIPVLEQAVRDGKLYAYPPQTAKGKPRYWWRDLPTFLQAAVEKVIPHLERPLTSREFLKHLPIRLTPAEIQPILQAVVGKNLLFVLPPATARGEPRFWNQDWICFGRQTVVELVRKKGPQPAMVLLKALKGYSREQGEAVFTQALASQELWRFPVCGKVKKELLGGTPPSPAPYLKDLGMQLETIVPVLLKAGVPSGELRRSLIEILDTAGISIWPPAASSGTGISGAESITSRSPDLVALMTRIEPRAARGALVSVAELRRAAAMQKKDFDQAVLELAREERVTLHRHDYPGSLTPQVRDDLISDGAGTYYVGLALRQE